MFLDSMRINISPPPRIKSEEEFVTLSKSNKKYKVSSAHSAVRLYKRFYYYYRYTYLFYLNYADMYVLQYKSSLFLTTTSA